METKDWTSAPQLFDEGRCKLYNIKREEDMHAFSKENLHFNQLAAQFSKLCNIGINKVTEVDVIEYTSSSNVLIKYKAKQEEFAMSGKSSKETIVFHGTGVESNFLSIAVEGFKIGGQNVKVANGAAYGAGVYTAVGPSTPIQYSKGIAKVMIVRALEGRVDQFQGKGVSDTLIMNGDWRVFKTAAQCLPIGIIVFGENELRALGVPMLPQRLLLPARQTISKPTAEAAAAAAAQLVASQAKFAIAAQLAASQARLAAAQLAVERSNEEKLFQNAIKVHIHSF